MEEGPKGRLFNEERRTQSYAGATMLEQILEPGQEEEVEVEEPGFLTKITLLPGFGILLAIGCVLVGQVSANYHPCLQSSQANDLDKKARLRLQILRRECCLK